MSNLSEVAKQFHAAKLATAGQIEQGSSEDDLQDQIDRRVQESLAQASSGEVSSASTDPDLSVVAVEASPPDFKGGSPTDGAGPADPALLENPVERAGEVDRGVADPTTAWQIPAPVTRALGGRKRVPVELPISLESLRLQAKGVGMVSGHLVLSAMHAHRSQFLSQAARGDYQGGGPREFTKQWQLMWHEQERDEFDQLVDQAAEYLPRRSRAHVAALLLGLCAEASP